MKNFSKLNKATFLIAMLASVPAYAAVTSSSSATPGTAGVNGGVNAGTNTGSNVNGVPMNSTNTTTNVNTGTTSNSGISNSNSWNTENAYWKNNYPSRPYYNNSRDYSYYEPAYRYGVDTYNRNQGKSYDELSQSDLSNGWSNARGKSNTDWSDVQMATRDAYTRMYDAQHNAPAAGAVQMAPASR